MPTSAIDFSIAYPQGYRPISHYMRRVLGDE